MPKKGHSIYSEIECYALPYGVIGFLSHILTYYTMFLLTFGRSPFAPWRRLNSPKLDLFLAIAGLAIGTTVTIFSMVRCRQRWQFLLLAVWKAMLSITLGALSAHSATLVHRIIDYSLITAKTAWWLLLYVLGIVIGFVGLVSLIAKVWDHNPFVGRTTEIFSYILAVILFVALITAVIGFKLSSVVLIVLILFGALSALYSDWILAGIAGNLLGMPTADNTVLYFLYFAAKRLSFFSI
ncbi:hypothetical protein K440DRAFT_547721 [Wilcoxina mikolae CBS 423.85]|nr:hypothetical protein K440DRAFT_547721 [Wilcoxina mikolae CBS 423.85]